MGDFLDEIGDGPDVPVTYRPCLVVGPTFKTSAEFEAAFPAQQQPGTIVWEEPNARGHMIEMVEHFAAGPVGARNAVITPIKEDAGR